MAGGYRKVLYRPSWQRLRVSFLSENNPFGGFTSIVGTDDNLRRLNNYIFDAFSKTNEMAAAPAYVQAECARMKMALNEEFACRVWRGINLLNATHMGFSGMGLVGSEMDKEVVAYRDVLQSYYSTSDVQRSEANWNWDVVQFELEELWRNERYWFTKIYESLTKRNKTATKRRARTGGPQVDATRPELQKFLAIMEAVNRYA